MSLTAAILTFLAVIVLVVVIFRKKAPGGLSRDSGWPLYGKKVLSQPEQVLYFRLMEALPNNIILAQVQLSRFLGVQKGHNFHAWNNRINRMSVDFLVCRKDSSVLAAVELDDSTHDSPARQASDRKKNAAIIAAEIPIIRWNTREIPNTETIRDAVLSIEETTSNHPNVARLARR